MTTRNGSFRIDNLTRDFYLLEGGAWVKKGTLAAAAGSGAFGEVDNQGTPGNTGFWSNVDGNASVWRFTQRLFVGGAIAQDDTRVGAQPSPGFIPNAAAGANWAVRDAQLASMQTRGGIAVAGLSRSSDGEAVASPPATIGVAGYAINDAVSHAVSCWGLYSDVQYQPSLLTKNGFGIEIAVKNKADNRESTPDFQINGTFGIWINCGDPTYGGVPTNPNNTGILIGSGDSGNTWNRGIVFQNDGLTQDPVFGRARAISLGKLHHISWYDGSNHECFYITSGVVTAGKGMSQLVLDNLMVFSNQNGDPVARFVNSDFATANSLQFVNSVAGAPVIMEAFGTDADVNIQVSPKGAGTFNVESVAKVKATTFAALPTGAEGMLASLTDANTATPGATITAGGSTNHVLAYHNGTAWRVVV